MTTTDTQDAGWYSDPDDSARLRFWSGTHWTEHRRAASPSVVAAATAAQDAVAAPRVRMRYADRERAARAANPMAYVGALLGVIGLIIDVFGVVGVLAIVFSSIGLANAAPLRRAGVRYSGTVMASIGLALGVLLTLRVIVAVALGFLTGLGVQH